MKLILLLSLCLSVNLFAGEKKIIVYAASSLTNVLEQISKQYQTKTKIVFNFDSSSKLAKQIESGAPADIYFSADVEWMNYLEKKELILAQSKKPLLSNRLVLIAPADAKVSSIQGKAIEALDYKHLAIASETVPAGKYGREALKFLNLLNPGVEKKMVNADNVRIALTWVASHEAELGIVYRTDALVEPKVKVVYEFPEGSHEKIIYPLAIIKKSAKQAQAQEFINFCQSKAAKDVFTKAGFIHL